MFNTEYISDKIDEVEEELFTHELIKSFESRGWGLYKSDEVDNFDNLEQIHDIVLQGRAKNSIEYGSRYILLPLNDNDADWSVIRQLIFKLRDDGRGPYFIDIVESEDENGKWVEPSGVFLIDSVIIKPPLIMLVIDKRLSIIKNKQINDGFIEIHFSDIHKIRKQLMLSLRKK